jgi:hypothetical protein
LNERPNSIWPGDQRGSQAVAGKAAIGAAVEGEIQRGGAVDPPAGRKTIAAHLRGSPAL